MTVGPPACPSVVAALSSPVERSLNSLIEEYGWENEELLGSLMRLREVLGFYDIDCLPPIGEGDLTESRVLRRKDTPDLTSILTNEIADGESSTLEFKSSLMLDRKKLTFKPGLAPLEYRSTEVIFSALKTIVAFSNSRGGTLLIGIEDSGNPIGIEGDYSLMKQSESPFDVWELTLRSLIEQHIHNGFSLNSYVAIQRIAVGQCTIARLQIAQRLNLSFLKRDGRLELYVRSGNRSIPVPLEEIENFFEMKKRYM